MHMYLALARYQQQVILAWTCADNSGAYVPMIVSTYHCRYLWLPTTSTRLETQHESGMSTTACVSAQSSLLPIHLHWSSRGNMVCVCVVYR